MTNSLQTITNQIYCNFLYLCIGLDSPAALTQEQADLGGVFTGVGAEAFVGGFDLLGEINELNQVSGFDTIES